MMAGLVVQLVLHYDGTAFSGWQSQPEARTVQGVLEQTLERLCDTRVRVTGAGRTDAGVHARGQAAGITVPAFWEPERLRRALNGRLPADVWVAAVHPMREEFHARFSATSRRYSYAIGLGAAAASPFARLFATPWETSLERAALDWCAERIIGDHRFLGFAVRGTAPPTDEHRCVIHEARWRESESGLVFDIEANRFLHHMVRFLVGTMLDVAGGQRTRESFAALLTAEANDAVSPPAPPVGLCLEQVRYPAHLYA